MFIDEMKKISILLKNKEFVKRLTMLSLPWFAVGCGSYGMHFSIKLVNFDIFQVSISSTFYWQVLC
jgi:hypothetical protein